MITQSATTLRRDGLTTPVVVPPRPPKSPFAMSPQRATAARVISKVKILHRDEVLDANESSVFTRQLLYIMPKVYLYKVTEARYADLWPLNFDVPNGADSHGYHQYEQIGQAEIVDDYSDDAPVVDIMGHETLGQVFGLRSRYFWSIQDIRRAAMTNMPLQTVKPNIAKAVIERKVDSLCAVGDAKHFTTGIANDPNATTVTASTKAAGGTKWGTLTGGITLTVSATPTEIVNDLTNLLNAIFLVSQGNITPDTIIFPSVLWSIINTLRLDNFNMVTVAKYLFDALPWVKTLEYWPQLDTAGSGGLPRLLVAQRNAENFEFIIPQPFEQFTPDKKGMLFQVDCHERVGGWQVRQPKALAYMDGLVAFA